MKKTITPSRKSQIARNGSGVVLSRRPVAGGAGRLAGVRHGARNGRQGPLCGRGHRPASSGTVPCRAAPLRPERRAWRVIAAARPGFTAPCMFEAAAAGCGRGVPLAAAAAPGEVRDGARAGRAASRGTARSETGKRYILYYFRQDAG